MPVLDAGDRPLRIVKVWGKGPGGGRNQGCAGPSGPWYRAFTLLGVFLVPTWPGEGEVASAPRVSEEDCPLPRGTLQCGRHTQGEEQGEESVSFFSAKRCMCVTHWSRIILTQRLAKIATVLLFCPWLAGQGQAVMRKPPPAQVGPC